MERATVTTIRGGLAIAACLCLALGGHLERANVTTARGIHETASLDLRSAELREKPEPKKPPVWPKPVGPAKPIPPVPIPRPGGAK